MVGWKVRRKHPYTEKGIRRCKCIRCGKPATFQWQICSDGNNFRPLCVQCDIELNLNTLLFMKHPNVEELMEAYTKRLAND